MTERHKPIKKPSIEQLAGGLNRQIKNRSNRFGLNQGKLLGGAELATILGVDTTELSRWRDEGCPCLPDPRHRSRFLYNSGMVLRWRYQVDIDEIAETVKNVEPQLNDAMESREADRRYKVAKALREELELAKEQQLVANIDDLMGDFSTAAGQVRATLMSWQGRLPGLLAHKDDKTVADILTAEIEDVLQSMTEYEHGR